MKLTPWAALCVALVLAFLLLTGCAKTLPAAGPSSPSSAPTSPSTPASSSGDIALGAFFGNTGSFATFGISSTNALRLACDEANAAGGVLGKKFNLTVEDDQCKAEEAANAVQKLIQQNQVLCVLGEVASSNSLAAAPICQNAKTPMVTPSSTNPAVTKTGDYIFRVCFTDDFQGLVMSRFAHDKLHAKTAVIFSDVSSDYSKGLSQVFRDDFTKSGGKILAEESYTQGDKDFRAQLTKFKPLNPDVMYVPGYYGEVSMIMLQARQLGLTCPGLGGDGWDSPKLVDIGGKAVEGCFFSNHYSKDDPNPVVQKFVAAYTKTYKEAPDALAACAYDAFRVVAEALKRAGKVDRTALRDALAQTKDFDGVTGKITIDANRNARKSATILTIKNGKQAFVQTMAPQ
jgi:branched-chain amino acid transport system substrate-binding protein